MTFYEMGSGNGHMSQLLLESGLTGRGFDLNADANAFNRRLNAAAIKAGRYAVEDHSFIDRDGLAPVDLIISAMVIEHLEKDLVEAFFSAPKVCSVSMAAWSHWCLLACGRGASRMRSQGM